MRVAIVFAGDSRAAYGGGTERRFCRVFSHLRDSAAGDPEVHLFLNAALAEAMRRGGVLEPTGDECHVIPGESLSAFMTTNRELIRQIRRLNPDIVHLPLIQRALLPFYCWLVNTRFTLVVSVTLATLASHHRPYLPTVILARLMWQRANLIDSLYPSFAQSHGRRYEHKTMLGPGSFTDPTVFRPQQPKEKVITFAGRLIEAKGPLTFVEALSIVRAEQPDLLSDWRVEILGQGPLQENLQYRLRTGGLDNVGMRPVTTIAPYVNKSQIFASVQLIDNYPSQSLLEAMAAGNAVVASDVGHTRLLVDDSTGVLASPGNPREVARGLLELMRDGDRCSLLGRNARQRILGGYTADRYCAYVKELWNHAANG